MSQSSPRYVVGIDLGTTNCAVAYVDASAEDPSLRAFPISQVVAPGAVEPRPTLPSFLYLPAPSELAPGALALPWAEPEFTVGELARSHGWKTPTRLVSSAKSWLCHPGIDREAACLPWQAPDEVPKVSPVEASSRYLAHIRAAWDQVMAKDDPAARLEAQDVFVTVPASFDAVARELTVRAAQAAGLPQLTLLEEPQAAFYAWLAACGEDWRRQLQVDDVVLVCDVGGGTTDFSLISVAAADGNLALERVAVGEHILLGGDNMDLALAHVIKARLEAEGTRLDGWQLTSLVHSARHAKEQLLESAALDTAPVVVLGRGSKVVGGSVQAELERAELERTVLEGFFPPAGLGERPKRDRRVGLRELGLPFAADAAITRHLAQFLGSHRKATCVLFNGGVMKSRALRQRIVETLDGWSDSPEEDLKVLEGTDLDLAVAHGAAYYGLVRRGRGVRIRGGTARAYYIGIESSMPAVPGMAPPLKALCVAPFGMEEGSEAELAERELGLVIGEPAEFRFLSSTTRRDDLVGTLIEEVGEDPVELAPIATQLGEPGDAQAGQVVPVTLHSKVTEVGTLELWCAERGGERRWKLEYNVREGAAGS